MSDCKCIKKVKQKQKNIEEESFAMYLLKEHSKNAKKWFIIAIALLVCWLGTIGAFLLYLNQYDFSGYSVEGVQDGYGVNIIGGGDVYNGATSKNNN